MSIWKTAEEAKRIVEEYKNREELMVQARHKIADKIDEALKNNKNYTEITVEEIPLKYLRIICKELIKDKYNAKIKEEEPLTDNQGVAWGVKPARLEISWFPWE